MDGWNGWVYREVISTGGGLAKVHMKFSGKRDLALGGCSYYRLLYMVSYKLNYGGEDIMILVIGCGFMAGTYLLTYLLLRTWYLSWG